MFQQRTRITLVDSPQPRHEKPEHFCDNVDSMMFLRPTAEWWRSVCTDGAPRLSLLPRLLHLCCGVYRAEQQRPLRSRAAPGWQHSTRVTRRCARPGRRTLKPRVHAHEVARHRALRQHNHAAAAARLPGDTQRRPRRLRAWLRRQWQAAAPCMRHAAARHRHHAQRHLGVGGAGEQVRSATAAADVRGAAAHRLRWARTEGLQRGGAGRVCECDPAALDVNGDDGARVRGGEPA